MQPLYLENAVMSTGEIIIDKKYVVNSVADQNMFRVKVTAADYKGNTRSLKGEGHEEISSTGI